MNQKTYLLSFDTVWMDLRCNPYRKHKLVYDFSRGNTREFHTARDTDPHISAPDMPYLSDSLH